MWTAFLGSSFAQSKEPASLLKVCTVFSVVQLQLQLQASVDLGGSSSLALRGGR